jgi:hypothetical protein
MLFNIDMHMIAVCVLYALSLLNLVGHLVVMHQIVRIDKLLLPPSLKIKLVRCPNMCMSLEGVVCYQRLRRETVSAPQVQRAVLIYFLLLGSYLGKVC